MATTKNRGVAETEILPPCQRDTGQLCLTEFFRLGEGSGMQQMACDTGEAFFREVAVLRFELDAEVTAVEESGGNKGAAGTCKGVEDEIAGAGESFNKRVEDADGLLGGMHFVAGIFPGLNVVDGTGRFCGTAFCQDIGLFVAGAEEACAGGIAFGPDDVSDGCEAGVFPCTEESIDAVPAVERDAEAVRFQYAVQVGKGAENAFWIGVVGDGAAAAVFVADEVGRVGQDEIDAVVGHGFQELRAIALQHAVLKCGVHGALPCALACTSATLKSSAS